MAEIDISIPGFDPAFPAGSSARVSRQAGFPVPCGCCCPAAAPNFAAPAPKAVAAGAAPNSPPDAGAGAAAPNAPGEGAGAAAPKSPVVAGAGAPKPPNPPAAGAGAPNTLPVAGAGAAPKGLDAGLPKALAVAVVEPKAPRPEAGAAETPNGLAGAAAGAPKAPVAGAAPNGVEAVRPKAEVDGAAAPKVVVAVAAGAPKTLDFAPKALVDVPKPPLVAVLPNVWMAKTRERGVEGGGLVVRERRDRHARRLKELRGRNLRLRSWRCCYRSIYRDGVIGPLQVTGGERHQTSCSAQA